MVLSGVLCIIRGDGVDGGALVPATCITTCGNPLQSLVMSLSLSWCSPVARSVPIEMYVVDVAPETLLFGTSTLRDMDVCVYPE